MNQIKSLKLVFATIFVAILAVTIRTSLIEPVWTAVPRMLEDPWTVATFYDTYFAFFTIWLWIAYKEKSAAKRVLWLILIFALGNIASAFYILLSLHRLPKDATFSDLLLKRA